MFELSEEHQQFRELAHEFAKNEIRPVSAEYDQTMKYPWEVIKKAHELGLMNMHVPEAYGGLGLGAFPGSLIRIAFSQLRVAAAQP